jgi:hypothetical protein
MRRRSGLRDQEDKVSEEGLTMVKGRELGARAGGGWRCLRDEEEATAAARV